MAFLGHAHPASPTDFAAYLEKAIGEIDLPMEDS